MTAVVNALLFRHLAGDESLDGVLQTCLSSLSGSMKDGDILLKEELKREAAPPEPFVKLEQDEPESDNDDFKNNYNYNDDDEDEDIKQIDVEVESCDRCSKSYQIRGHLVKHLQTCNPDQIERLKKRYKGHLRFATETSIESCDKCDKDYLCRAAFLKHLSSCNPDQIERLSEKNQDPVKSENSAKKRKDTLSRMSTEDCEGCGKQFKHRSFLLRHLKTCNPDQIPKLTSKMKTNWKVQKRMESILAEDNALNCNFCARKFTFKKSLEKHEFMHQTEPDNPKLKEASRVRIRGVGGKGSQPKGNYQCDRCSTSFVIYSALERHMEAHNLASSSRTEDDKDEKRDHGLGLKTKEIRYISSSIILIISCLRDGALMRCVKCDLTYTTHGMYRLHMRQYHEKALSCEECGKRFTLPNSLITHRLNHHTSFPKDCDDCGQFQPTKQQYQDHMRIEHGVGVHEAPVPCEICGKQVRNKYTLKSHVKMVHERGGVNYPCDQCGKILKSKSSLEYHSKVHTGEYKFR